MISFEMKSSLKAYTDWATPHFKEGDLFVTASVIGIRNVSKYAQSICKKLEDKVVKRRGPDKIVRYVVHVPSPSYPHLHMMFQNCAYVNQSTNIFSFEEQIKKEFGRHSKEVHVARITTGSAPVNTYNFEKQGGIEVLLNATYLPSV